jgi:mannose-6-phosphate isomerase-like protein (cupin superfamily)
MADSGSTGRRPVVLGPGEGRAYPMGRISAVFKADGAETGQLYSISEWWLDPHTKGPGAHSHPEDDVFYVLAGTMSVLVGTEWIEASTGSFVVVPGHVIHDFENRGTERAGVLNVSAPGNFEQRSGNRQVAAVRGAKLGAQSQWEKVRRSGCAHYRAVAARITMTVAGSGAHYSDRDAA